MTLQSRFHENRISNGSMGAIWLSVVTRASVADVHAAAHEHLADTERVHFGHGGGTKDLYIYGCKMTFK